MEPGCNHFSKHKYFGINKKVSLLSKSITNRGLLLKEKNLLPEGNKIWQEVLMEKKNTQNYPLIIPATSPLKLWANKMFTICYFISVKTHYNLSSFSLLPWGQILLLKCSPLPPLPMIDIQTLYSTKLFSFQGCVVVNTFTDDRPSGQM